MPYSSGTYSLPSGNPVVTGTTISSSTTNTTNSDIATALSTCVLKDGTQTITANLPMASHKLTGLSAGTTAGDSVEYGGSPTFTNVTATNVTAASVTTTGATGSLNSINTFGFKNRIINGNMAIDQRNAGAAQTLANSVPAYCIDRWKASSYGANSTGQQISNGAGGYRYQITGAASVSAIGFQQRIESSNSYDMANSTATLSVDLSDSLLTTVSWAAYYATAKDNFTSVTSIASGTFTVTSSIARYSASISIPSAAITGLMIEFSVGAQTSGTLVLGNVQLEKGSVATSFDQRAYGTELSLCQRYYQKFTFGSYTVGCSTFSYTVGWKVNTRVAPTPTTSGGSFANFNNQSWNETDTFGSRYSMALTTTNGGAYNQTVELLGAEL
jgi:hypothetical protein